MTVERTIRKMRTFTVILATVVLSFTPLSQGCNGADNDKSIGNPSDVSGSDTDGGGESAVVSVLNINFRTGPSPDSAPVVGRPALYYGAVLEVLETEGEWLRVRHTSGDEGWVRSRYDRKEYLRVSDERPGEMLSSEAFLDSRAEPIYGWAPDACVYLLWGMGANFDGLAREWVAVFIADSKPGLKLYVDGEKTSEWAIGEPPPSPELGTDAYDEEYLDEVSGPVAGALRLSYYDPYTGPSDPLTSTELCVPENFNAFLSSKPVRRDREVIEAGNAYVELKLTGEVWRIELGQSPYSGIVGEFNPATGKFLKAYGELLYDNGRG